MNSETKTNLVKLYLLQWVLIGFIVMAMPTSFLVLIALSTILSQAALITLVILAIIFWCAIFYLLLLKAKSVYLRLTATPDSLEKQLIYKIVLIGLNAVLNKFSKNNNQN